MDLPEAARRREEEKFFPSHSQTDNFPNMDEKDIEYHFFSITFPPRRSLPLSSSSSSSASSARPAPASSFDLSPIPSSARLLTCPDTFSDLFLAPSFSNSSSSFSSFCHLLHFLGEETYESLASELLQ